MPDKDDGLTRAQVEIVKELTTDVERLQKELEQCRSDAALVVLALNAALMWGEALFSWLPSGMVLSDGVKSAKYQLDLAMRQLKGGRSGR